MGVVGAVAVEAVSAAAVIIAALAPESWSLEGTTTTILAQSKEALPYWES